MRRLLLVLIISFSSFSAHSQTTRYFEFITNCGHGNWQDTSFIVSATDQALIDTVLAELAKPLVQRRFIGGPITHENGGFNHNASHWFRWHFIPDQWVLSEMAAEVCDGCPYTDVDADTAYWIGLLGMYCPWSGQPSREVAAPTGIKESNLENQILLHPIPTSQMLYINRSSGAEATATIYNSTGNKLFSTLLTGNYAQVEVNAFPPGLYFLKINDNKDILAKKFVIDR